MRLKQILLLAVLLPATVVAGLPGRDINAEIANSNRVVATATRNTSERTQNSVNTTTRVATSRPQADTTRNQNTRAVSSRATTGRATANVVSRTTALAQGGGQKNPDFCKKLNIHAYHNTKSAGRFTQCI